MTEQTKKAKGSALDRGFPTAMVLILLVILVIILQGISAWKVINLEGERAAIEKKEALLEKDINDFEKLKRELPVLKGERDQLKKDIPKLEGTKNDLIRQATNLERQLAQARETIERSKEVEKIKIDLEKAANEFKTEIKNKTNEIMRLAGPNSLIQKSAGDLKTLINNLDKVPKQLNQVIIQAKGQINSSLNTVNKAATSLQSEVESFSSTSRKMVTDIQRVSKIATNVIKRVKETEEKLSNSSKQLATQIHAIDNNLDNLEINNQKFSNEAMEVSRIASDINSTADKFKNLYADTEQAFNTFNEYTNSLAVVISILKADSASIRNTLGKIQAVENLFKTETDKLSDSSKKLEAEIESFRTIVARNQTKSAEFSNNTNKIGNTAADLSAATEKVQKFSEETGPFFRSLKDNAASLESVIGNLTTNNSIIKNTGNDLQIMANGMSTNVNIISRKIDIIERDASDFSQKIRIFNPSKVEDAIEEYTSQLSRNMEKISSGSDNLSNLNQNVEIMINELQNEIELFKQSLEKQRKSLTETQEISSKNKSY